MRPNRSLLKGSVNDKLSQIERQLILLNRRRGNYVIGVTPPIPVFDWTQNPDSDGVVFRKLMPGNGKITIGCMYIEQLDKKLSPKAVLTVDGVLGGTKINIPITKQATSVQADMFVEFGQRLTLSIEPAGACSGIWTAFLFEVDVKHTQQDKQLVDGFLELVDVAEEELDNA